MRGWIGMNSHGTGYAGVGLGCSVTIFGLFFLVLVALGIYFNA